MPYASAAIACAPPTRYTTSTPASAAAARIASWTVPSGRGGVHSATSRHAGDARRQRGHQHRRREAAPGRRARNSRPGPPARRARGRARRCARARRRRPAAPRATQRSGRGPARARRAASGSRRSRAAAELGRGYREIVDAAPVEALGEVARRRRRRAARTSAMIAATASPHTGTGRRRSRAARCAGRRNRGDRHEPAWGTAHRTGRHSIASDCAGRIAQPIAAREPPGS